MKRTRMSRTMWWDCPRWDGRNGGWRMNLIRWWRTSIYTVKYDVNWWPKLHEPFEPCKLDRYYNDWNEYEVTSKWVRPVHAVSSYGTGHEGERIAIWTFTDHPEIAKLFCFSNSLIVLFAELSLWLDPNAQNCCFLLVVTRCTPHILICSALRAQCTTISVSPHKFPKLQTATSMSRRTSIYSVWPSLWLVHA